MPYKESEQYLYLYLYNQLSYMRSQLIILVESPKDDSAYQYIYPCLGGVLSTTPLN